MTSWGGFCSLGTCINAQVYIFLLNDLDFLKNIKFKSHYLYCRFLDFNVHSYTKISVIDSIYFARMCCIAYGNWREYSLSITGESPSLNLVNQCDGIIVVVYIH